MDLVLEFFDTFAFDRLYATVIPASNAWTSVDPKATAVNATFSSRREAPTPYHYQPASQFYSLQPTEWAYKSAWPRDNGYRQLLSLYLITWYLSHQATGESCLLTNPPGYSG